MKNDDIRKQMKKKPVAKRKEWMPPERGKIGTIPTRKPLIIPKCWSSSMWPNQVVAWFIITILSRLMNHFWIANWNHMNFQDIKVNGDLPKDEEQSSVTVMGMETRASCENGGKWSRPDSPVLRSPEPPAPIEPTSSLPVDTKCAHFVLR